MKTQTMKIIQTILIGLFSVLTTFGQDKKCCDTYVYEGYILTDQNKKLEINLNFLVLLDSTMVGSYYCDPNWGSLKLVGKLNPDFTFYLVERDKTDSITGFFEGKLNTDYKLGSGKWTDGKKEKVFDFEIKQVIGKSYWDYIKKNRALYEYKDLKLAIKEKEKVLSIDIGDQGVKKLPKKLRTLPNIVSFNLMGNEFKSFPKVLTELKTLDEISLSTNKLENITSEIGNLKNLRILIMNNNQLIELPKEIGELTNLLYLEIGNNKLTSLPEEIKYLTSLQELHIERNNLSESEKQRIKKLLPKCIIHF
ncbi:MAG: leucine-rich repeat domain-containing protein [Ignavibacteria bacterium]|nr:leucine-rich repeat domain-containing protein [Ignavibacteria bacterium]